ncbi:MAG: glutamate--tRNA ligase [Candidatus Omnitrophica bacterium]|nr:glutamate--tRNA ligase [Candidatus Omnitrophota bacterium]
MSDQVRVRFAPSPTGFLHIGGVRTALFNFLFARKEKGNFLLRIEDTDRERSRPEFENEILDSLKWLGLTWDGEILRQSERLSVYQKAAQELIQNDFAYRIEEAGKIAVKFKIPKEKVEFQDLVHGPIEFDAALLDDLVIIKSDGYPTYHFACVVDDHHMGITHVIRGDDHISNTPRQILIYEALGWDTPKFGHLPLVFGSDKTPLSKRHGAVSLSAYQKEGYLPEGIVNYLALLGWSSGGDEEMFTLKELIGKFQIEGINKTNACFDPEKLKWINGEHIRRLSNSDYLERLGRFLEGSNVVNRPRFKEIALLYKERIRTFSELMEQASFFFREAIEYDLRACAKHFKDLETKRRLEKLSRTLEKLEDFSDLSKLELCVRKTAEELALEGRALIHPVRVAISGRSVTPGLFEVMSLLGKEEVLKRIQYVIINFNQLHAGGE